MRMHPRLLLGIALLLAASGLGAVADDSKQQTIKKAQNELQGTWKLVSVQSGGKQIPAEDFAGARITFKGDKLIMGGPKGQGEEQPYKIDPTKEPKTFDQTFKYKMEGPGKGKQKTIDRELPVLGIYKIEGNKLTICESNPSDDRPADFQPDKKRHVLVLEREKR